MNILKRWRVKVWSDFQPEYFEDDNGMWVRYKDVQKLVNYLDGDK